MQIPLLDHVLYKYPRQRRVHADLLENEKDGSISTAYICNSVGNDTDHDGCQVS